MPDVLIEGLRFPEGPRWHDGRLWFSDFYFHEVVAVDLGGNREHIVSVPGQPSGLGWLPAEHEFGEALLIVSMTDRRLLRLDTDGLHLMADLSALATAPCNDMVVDGEGRAYIGNFGFNRHAGEKFTPATLIRVDPDGSVHIADPEGLAFPNGSVITPDGRTLIVAESYGRRLTQWSRHADGTLYDRRLFADLGDTVPDGICLDEAGAIWVADPRNNEVVRVWEGGSIDRRISTGDRGAYACMLGGADRRTLFICTAKTSGPEAAKMESGRIEMVDVEVPGTGWP